MSYFIIMISRDDKYFDAECKGVFATKFEALVLKKAITDSDDKYLWNNLWCEEWQGSRIINADVFNDLSSGKYQAQIFDDKTKTSRQYALRSIKVKEARQEAEDIVLKLVNADILQVAEIDSNGQIIESRFYPSPNIQKKPLM